jgi:two-component system response regulator FlrC
VGWALGVDSPELAAGEQFELILTDMLNWPMDGLALLLCTKEFPDIPSVVASAIRGDAVVQGCFRSGACEYLLMPFSREQLLATVSRALEREKEATKNLESPPETR